MSASATLQQQAKKRKMSAIARHLETCFRAQPDRFWVALKLMRGEDEKVSLRMIDWFVTNYAREYGTKSVNQNGEPVSVHACYKARLGALHKECFDVFHRGAGEKSANGSKRQTRAARIAPYMNIPPERALELGRTAAAPPSPLADGASSFSLDNRTLLPRSGASASLARLDAGTLPARSDAGGSLASVDLGALLQCSSSMRQLNYLLWAQTDGVLEYIRAHYDEIRAHMHRGRLGSGKRRLPDDKCLAADQSLPFYKKAATKGGRPARPMAVARPVSSLFAEL